MDKKQNTFDSLAALYEGQELVLNTFSSEIFSIRKTGKGLKIWTSKQMPQRLPIASTQVKGDNTSENLLNEIRQIIYSLYPSNRNYSKSI